MSQPGIVSVQSAGDRHFRNSPGLRSPLVCSLILVIGTLILYSPALNNAFVNYDDPAYVTANPHVLRGFSWSNLHWAITATDEANWHPLSWISHMADVQFFGTNARGHHLVSILLHALNVLLLFFVLNRATGHVLRSALVAGLFAVHPLNVECVAWVAERKSLLSMLFLLLALLAYQRYAQKRSVGGYALVALLFALGLAAKPMVLTLPVLLLLWDYWPLQNIGSRAQTSPAQPAFARLVAEKLPLLALSAASAAITILAQHRGGALGTTALLPLGIRIKNAIYCYMAYVGKGIWPSALAVFYPHPEASLATWKVLAAGLLILLVTGLTWRYRERHRYLLTGWLWYLVAIAPMIGVVQVGRQAMADRYAYLPFVGLFIIAVWGTTELFERFQVRRFARAAIASAALLTFASISFLQVNYWRNSYTLFSHALKVTQRNGIAEDNLGATLMEMGRSDLALPHIQAAVAFMPQLSTAHYNLGVLYQQHGNRELAKREYELALQFTGDAIEAAQAHSNLGFVLLDINDDKAAVKEFTAALQIIPLKQNSLLGRGIAEYRQGNFDAAIADLSRATGIAPLALADFWLGRALEAKGQTQEAARAYEAALQLAPAMAEAQHRLDALRARLR